MKFYNATIPKGEYTDIQIIRLMSNEWFLTLLETNKVKTFAQFKVVCKKISVALKHREVSIIDLSSILQKVTRGFNNEQKI